MENMQIVEINGVKFEIDLNKVRKITNYKVGDRVKVLVKNYSGYKSHSGVILGFDLFQVLPTIIIAYLDLDYSTAKITTLYLNAETKDVEVCPMCEDEFLAIEKSHVLSLLDRQIEKAKLEAQELELKKAFFLKQFGMYFNDLKEQV